MFEKVIEQRLTPLPLNFPTFKFSPVPLEKDGADISEPFHGRYLCPDQKLEVLVDAPTQYFDGSDVDATSYMFLIKEGKPVPVCLRFIEGKPSVICPEGLDAEQRNELAATAVYTLALINHSNPTIPAA